MMSFFLPSSFLLRSFFVPSFLLPSFFFFVLLFCSSSQTSSPSSVARCQHGPPDCSGQRRTSTAGARLQWAAPDLNRGALERTGQRRTSPGDLPSGVGSAGPQLPEDMSEDVSEICQKRMSEEMSDDMSLETSDNMSE